MKKGTFRLLKKSEPIVKAEQTNPESRNAKRQAERELKRKWPIKYKEESKEETED